MKMCSLPSSLPPPLPLSLSLAPFFRSSPWLCPSVHPSIPPPIHSFLGTYHIPSNEGTKCVKSRSSSSCKQIIIPKHKLHMAQEQHWLFLAQGASSMVTEVFKEVVTFDWLWKMIAKMQNRQGRERHFRPKEWWMILSECSMSFKTVNNYNGEMKLGKRDGPQATGSCWHKGQQDPVPKG